MASYKLLHEGKVALIRLGQATLGQAARTGLLGSLARAERDGVKSVVLVGGSDEGGPGSGSFSLGADIVEFARGRHLSTPSLHDILAALDASRVPVVCGLHGYALGGGLELALACHWRLATRDTNTRLGLPEVHLGLLPGAGGTQRLPRLVGYQRALEMMVSGRHVGADEALSMGLVDRLLTSPASNNQREMIAELVDFSRGPEAQGQQPRQALSSIPAPTAPSEQEWQRMLSETRAAAQGRDAPLAILGAVQAACYSPSFAKGQEAERRLFDALLGGAQSKALQYQFLARKRLSKAEGWERGKVAAARVLDVLRSEAAYTAALPGFSQEKVAAVVNRTIGLAPALLFPGNSERLPQQQTAASTPSREKDEGEEEIKARVIYAAINACFSILSERDGQTSPEHVDVALCEPVAQNGMGVPRHVGGLLFFAERGAGLRDVAMGLKDVAAKDGSRPAYAACGLLKSVVESGSTLREELFFSSKA